ncbi:MAG: ScpA family protein [Alphaproteobacteria bacterium]
MNGAAAPEGCENSEPALLLDLDGFEGPIDLLLTLAREQKLDLTGISILALAEQYLAFIAATRQLRLEVAADYLVMAAWLAFLKSRLLLPDPPEEDDGPSGEAMAAVLSHRLRLLEAMQRAGAALMDRPLLGRDVFPRGAPEGIPHIDRPVYELSLYELLCAYGDLHRRRNSEVLVVAPPALHSIDEALQRLARLVGHVPEWRELTAFLPDEFRGGIFRRSALAATFAAVLELARAGRIELRQESAFGPIHLRSPPTLRETGLREIPG